jgi:hypothetical protein
MKGPVLPEQSADQPAAAMPTDRDKLRRQILALFSDLLVFHF